MHAGHGNQVGALGLVELIQVRLVLEEVGVQALFRDLHVRLDVVGEDLDLQVHAFFGQGRLHEFEDLGVRNRSGRDGQGFSVGRECRNGREGHE
ncbi:hypothetical protein D3C87_1501480 [compost metagenome]